MPRLQHTRNKAYAGIALGLALTSPSVYAQNSEASKKLFDQAFAQRKKKTVQQIALPATVDSRQTGTVDAQIRSEGVWLSREDMVRVLKNVVTPRILTAVTNLEPLGTWLSTDALQTVGIQAQYSSQSITLDISIPLTLRQIQTLKIDSRGAEHALMATDSAITPEYWSLITNGRLTLSQTTNTGAAATHTGRLQLDGAQRAGSWVLENVGSLPIGQSSGSSSREITRLVRDWPQHAIRLVMGDISSVARSGVASIPMGGLQISRRFNLSPGLNPQSQPSQSLALPNGGSVDVKTNGFVSRTLHLAPGVYNLQDIPVFTGANAVELVVVEPGGKKSVHQFDYFFDSALLAKEFAEYDFSIGHPRQIGLNGQYYVGDQTVVAGSWRQGITNDTTLGAAIQYRSRPHTNVLLAQVDALWATRWGTVSGFVAQSKHPLFSGHSYSLQWRMQSAVENTAARAPLNWSAIAQLTRTGAGFASLSADTASIASREVGVRIAAVTAAGLSTSLSASMRTSDTAATESRAFAINARKNLSPNWSAEISVGRQKIALVHSQYATVSLRYSGEKSPAGGSLRTSMSYQSQEHILRTDVEATGINTVAGADATWRFSAGASNGAQGTEMSLRTALETSRAQWSAQWVETSNSLGKTRFLEADLGMAFIASPKGWAFAKPVADSAAQIMPREGYGNLSIYVDPSLDRSAASSDYFGAPVLTDLIGYVPREIQLDVANLPPGRSLGVDRPLLRPTYRSVSVVPLGSNANVQLSGVLLNPQGIAYGLVALRLTAQDSGNTVDLFTSRRGRFTSPSLPPGLYWLTIPGEAAPLRVVTITPDQTGLVDVGIVALKGEQP